MAQSSTSLAEHQLPVNTLKGRRSVRLESKYRKYTRGRTATTTIWLQRLSRQLVEFQSVNSTKASTLKFSTTDAKLANQYTQVAFTPASTVQMKLQSHKTLQGNARSRQELKRSSSKLASRPEPHTTKASSDFQRTAIHSAGRAKSSQTTFPPATTKASSTTAKRTTLVSNLGI